MSGEVYTRGEVSSLIACPMCDGPVVPSTSHQVYCGDRCRYRARDQRPQKREQSRRRNLAWRQAQNLSLNREPWLWGPPPYGNRLPGGLVSIELEPNTVSVTMRETRLLHGLVSAVLGDSGIAHDERHPTFSLRPVATRLGWEVYLWSDEAAAVLSGLCDDRHVDGRRVTVRFGEVRTVAAPVVTARGRRRLRLETVTLVSVRRSTEKGRAYHHMPTSQCIKSAIGRQFQERFGLEYADEDMRVEVVEHKTERDESVIGAKFRRDTGWSGVAIVECNAVAEWLLRAAASTGLGARVGFGLGCVKVTSA
jgi:hypothetical protein